MYGQAPPSPWKALSPGDALPIGTRVVRGPAWEWGEQDRGAGTVGEVVEDGEDGWWRVRWPHGETNSYRYTAEHEDITPVEVRGLP
jgi:hypothetical protein